MDKLLKVLHQIWVTKKLRDKILFTLFALFIFRLAAHVTIPGADITKIKFFLSKLKTAEVALC